MFHKTISNESFGFVPFSRGPKPNMSRTFSSKEKDIDTGLTLD